MENIEETLHDLRAAFPALRWTYIQDTTPPHPYGFFRGRLPLWTQFWHPHLFKSSVAVDMLQRKRAPWRVLVRFEGKALFNQWQKESPIQAVLAMLSWSKTTSEGLTYGEKEFFRRVADHPCTKRLLDVSSIVDW